VTIRSFRISCSAGPKHHFTKDGVCSQQMHLIWKPGIQEMELKRASRYPGSNFDLRSCWLRLEFSECFCDKWTAIGPWN